MSRIPAFHASVVTGTHSPCPSTGDSPKLETIPDSWLVDYNAALATIGFMMFLGFADDVLDIRCVTSDEFC